MVTVADINKAFKDKDIQIKLPLPEDWQIKKLELLEKTRHLDTLHLLLNVSFVNDRGEVKSDLFNLEGSMRRKVIESNPPKSVMKSEFLPVREKVTFDDEDEARAYMMEAMSHLLKDKGYSPGELTGADLYFEKGGRGFFINLAVRCDDQGLEEVKRLVKLRHEYGADYDYGLVIPAFQDSLGLSLRLEEMWISDNTEYLTAHRICVFAVDNADPNRLYPFTVYPKDRSLMSYFMVTTQQWILVRTRYVTTRKERREE